MKTIILNKGTLELPESWDDLTFKQKIFAFARLMEMIDGKITPPVFRMLMLQHITGYKPTLGITSWLVAWAVYLIRAFFIFQYYALRYDAIRLQGYWEVWKEYNRPQKRNREIINQNLYMLSEQLDFAFRLEKRKVVWNRYFYANPFPYLMINGRKFTGRKFIQDIAPFTNITTKEYCDCCELYSGVLSAHDPADKERCLNKMISILYPASDNYTDNLVSDHSRLIATLAPEIKFGIMYWFAGIVDFYVTHPVYSVLFNSDLHDDDQEDKISLKLEETVLMIEKKGFPTIADRTVNDFFNTQIKIIKDFVAEALATGMSMEELSNKTGYSVFILNKLS